MLVLLSFVLKLTTAMGGFNKKDIVPCFILLISLDQKPFIKFAWPKVPELLT